MKRLKYICLLLTMSLLSGIIAGCGGKTDGAAHGTPLEHAYIETALPVSIGNADVAVFTVAGGSLVYNATESSETERTLRIISTPVNGGAASVLWEKSLSSGTQSPVTENYYPVACDSDGDGNIWFLTLAYAVDMTVTAPAVPLMESKTMLYKIAPDGGELLAVNLDAVTGGLPVGQFMCAGNDGRICVALTQGVLVLDGATGEKVFAITDIDQTAGLARTDDGSVAYITVQQDSTNTSRKYTVKTIDFNTQSVAAEQNIAGAGYAEKFYTGSDGYILYIKTSDYILGYVRETGAVEVVVNFINSDIDSNLVLQCCPSENGGFIAATRDTILQYTAQGFSLLTPNTDAALVGKTLLQLGVLYLDPATKAAVIAFNKSSGDARIEIKDYSLYDNGAQQLDMDIVAGRAPDMISISNFEDFQPSKYISKGVFEDLYPYLDNDPDISRSDLFENILDAGATDGKLYRLGVYFQINTVVGKNSVFGGIENYTPKILEEIWDEHPDAALFYAMYNVTCYEWLKTAVTYGSGFINWVDGTCSFDSPEFVEMLEFSKRFPTAADPNFAFNNTDYMTTYAENGTLLKAELFETRSARSAAELFGEKIVFIGYPSPTGSKHGIEFVGNFSVFASSGNKEPAWSFIKTMLRENYAPPNLMYTFTLNRKAFDNLMTTEQTPLTERDLSGGLLIDLEGYRTVIYSAEDYADDRHVINYPLTDEEIAQTKAVIENASARAVYDPVITEIIIDEAAAYFGGVRTAEEAARNIQNRVMLYISESR